MMKKQDLMFVSNLSEKIADAEYEQIVAIRDVLEANSRLTNSSIFVVDFSKKELFYRSKNLIYTDEANQNDMQRESVNPYWSMIVEEDLDILLQTRKHYLNLVDAFPTEQKLNHTYIINYRIILKGKQFWIFQKFTPLKLRPDGTLWLGLFMVSPSSQKNCKSVSIRGESFHYSYDFKKNHFVLVPSLTKLTSIEKILLTRAAAGLTTEQIAESMGKSENTIKTHKRRLFKKMGVNSIVEALAYANEFDLLT